MMRAPALFAALMLVLLCMTPATTADLLKSKATLTQVASESSIPPAFLADANVGAAVAYAYYSGSLMSRYVTNECLVHGWEHGPAPMGSTFNTIRMQRQVGETLITTSISYAAVGEATANIAISADPANPIIVRSVRLGNYYTAELYSYDPVTCTLENGGVPLHVLDFQTLHPQVFTDLRTFNSGAGFSDDGKYLLYMLTLSDDGIVPSTSIYGLLETSLTGFVPRVQWFPPAVNGTGIFYPQPDIEMHLDASSGKYHILLANDNIIPGDPTAITSDAQLTAHHYDPVSDSVVQTGQIGSPQFVQNTALTSNLRKLYVTTNTIGIYGKSASQFPTQPYDAGLDKPYSELRLYRYNPNAMSDSLTFVDASDTECFGLSLALSADEKVLFSSCSREVITYAPVPGVGYMPMFGAGELASFRISGNNLNYQDSTAMPPLTLNIAPRPDGDYVAAVGMPTLSKADINLLRVERTN